MINSSLFLYKKKKHFPHSARTFFNYKQIQIRSHLQRSESGDASDIRRSYS